MSESIVEKDIFCPFCQKKEAVIISETAKERYSLNASPIGCDNAALLVVTGGCWALAKGIPLIHVDAEKASRLYGFCPCCGNTFPVRKP